jgi:hypothetical protein
MAAETNWAADAFEEFPISKWLSDLCNLFHQQHLEKSDIGKVKGACEVVASDDNAPESRVVKALWKDSGAEAADQLPKWMKTSQNDRLIAKLCMGGNNFSLS